MARPNFDDIRILHVVENRIPNTVLAISSARSVRDAHCCPSLQMFESAIDKVEFKDQIEKVKPE